MKDKTREFYEKFYGKKITQENWDNQDNWIMIKREQAFDLLMKGLFRYIDKDGFTGISCMHNNWIIHPDSVPCSHCGRILSNPFLDTPQESAAKRYRDNSTA